MRLHLLALALTAAASSAWLDVPFVRQEKNGCGAACLAMVSRYWREQGANIADPDPAKILDQLYAPKATGIFGSDMERYLQSAGFRTFVIQGQWADLETHLAKGRPLIICLGPRRDGTLHYVVVAGVNTPENYALLNDPADRKLRRIDRKELEKQWSATSHWTLLAVPQPQR